MKILMINKFLHPAGGAETYVFALGQCLEKLGHEVQYFGMENEKRICGNQKNLYTSPVDFHHAGRGEKLRYPFRIIYSKEAKQKMEILLQDFCPDIIHLNNFNYQLTPSVLEAAIEWRKKVPQTKIVLTAHDVQLFCPNHMMYRWKDKEVCEKCLHEKYHYCIQGRCIHHSFLRSTIGALEAWYWHKRKIYDHFDLIISPSQFLKKFFDQKEGLRDKTIVMQNFIGEYTPRDYETENYVLYFGRYSEEKGLEKLLHVCKELQDIPFVFAGKGPMEEMVSSISNIKNVGFQSGEELEKLIGKARFTICPSICYENCPFSVIESIIHHTPVLGADIGGIPELLHQETAGKLFRSGDEKDLADAIRTLWEDDEAILRYKEGCKKVCFSSVREYAKRLLEIYDKE